MPEKIAILDSEITLVFLMLALGLYARLLVPVMMKPGKAWVRFSIGVGLFVIYTAGLLLMIRYMTFESMSIEDCMIRVSMAVLLTNVMVLFAAAIYFFCREKRAMTQEEKMRLKDL